jgi:DNA-binding HxlR family transcriptional regulator
MVRPGLPLIDAPTISAVEFAACPVETSLGIVGRKWTLVILRDVAFHPNLTFGELLRRNPRITPRVLSLRLRSLLDDGVVERVTDGHDRRRVHYRLTPQGRDIVPVLVALVNYSIQHHARDVFSDGEPRRLEVVFPRQVEALLGDFASSARKPRRGPGP